MNLSHLKVLFYFVDVDNFKDIIGFIVFLRSSGYKE